MCASHRHHLQDSLHEQLVADKTQIIQTVQFQTFHIKDENNALGGWMGIIIPQMLMFISSRQFPLPPHRYKQRLHFFVM